MEQLPVSSESPEQVYAPQEVVAPPAVAEAVQETEKPEAAAITPPQLETMAPVAEATVLPDSATIPQEKGESVLSPNLMPADNDQSSLVDFRNQILERRASGQ